MVVIHSSKKACILTQDWDQLPLLCLFIFLFTLRNLTGLIFSYQWVRDDSKQPMCNHTTAFIITLCHMTETCLVYGYNILKRWDNSEAHTVSFCSQCDSIYIYGSTSFLFRYAGVLHFWKCESWLQRFTHLLEAFWLHLTCDGSKSALEIKSYLCIYWWHEWIQNTEQLYRLPISIEASWL